MSKRLSFTFRIFSFGFLAWRPVIIGRAYHGYGHFETRKLTIVL